MLAFGEDGLAAHPNSVYSDLPNMQTMEDEIFRKFIITFCKSHGVLENVYGALGRNQTSLDGDAFIKVFTDQAFLKTLVNCKIRGVFRTEKSGLFVKQERQQSVKIVDIFTPNQEISLQVTGIQGSEQDILKLPELFRQSLITGMFARQGDFLLFQSEDIIAKGARHQLVMRRDFAFVFLQNYSNYIAELVTLRCWQPMQLPQQNDPSLTHYQRSLISERYVPFCEERRQAMMLGMGGKYSWRLVDLVKEDQASPEMKEFRYYNIRDDLLWVQLPKE